MNTKPRGLATSTIYSKEKVVFWCFPSDQLGNNTHIHLSQGLAIWKFMCDTTQQQMADG